MNPPGNFSNSRAIREWCFVQLPLVELADLRRALRDRGLDDLGLFARDPWEVLDREGIIVPVAYARHGFWQHDLQGCLADKDFRIREESGYVSWDEIRAEAREMYGQRGGLQVLYSHWQILGIAELQAWLRPDVPWGNLGDGIEVFYEMRGRLARNTSSLAGWPEGEGARQRTRELLLARVQNMLWPFERGGPGLTNWRSGEVTGLTADAADWARDLLRNSDFTELASDCGTDSSGLEHLYEQLAYEGFRIDPNAQLLDLLDYVRRSRREQLKGRARLALDYYDAARIIRRWHFLATNETEQLPDIEELHGADPGYKQRRFGAVETLGGRSALPWLLEDYGLYPWRVQLIGEGDSELAALREILTVAYGLTFEQLGIATLDLGGADLPRNVKGHVLRRLLESLHVYANYFYLVIDNEGQAREFIEVLKQAKIVEGVGDEQRKKRLDELVSAAKAIEDPTARSAALKTARERSQRLEEEPGAAPEFLMWRENLEEDNFENEELILVANGLTRAACAVDPKELEIELADRRGAGVATVLVDLISKKGGSVTKPELARALARYAIEKPHLGDRRRPILELAEHLVRLTRADRRLRGQLR